MPILSRTTTALTAQLAGAAVIFRAAALQALWRKANFNPDQPRVPRGHPDGGRWTQVGDSPAAILVSDEGEPLGPPPDIPASRPTDATTRNRVIRSVAGWARTLSRRAGPVGLFLDYLDSTRLTTDLNEIDAYLDEPKTLEELQRDVAFRKKGYHIHHIVEQTPAADDGFPRSMIDGPGLRPRPG